MTREELKEHCQRQVRQYERVGNITPVTPNDWKRYEEHKLILELLEQETAPFDFELYKAGLMDMPKGIIEVLDQIRAEIEQKARPNETGGRENGKSIRYGLCMALQIIDKYRKVQADADCEIPDKIYESVQDGTYCGTLYKELKSGIPLPKGHGDLIDRSEVIKSLFDYHNGKKTIGQCIDDVQTIIEADEESEDKDADSD